MGAPTDRPASCGEPRSPGKAVIASYRPMLRPEARDMPVHVTRTALSCLLALFVLAHAAPGEATEYKRGNWVCEDFEDSERFYKNHPDNVAYQVGYGVCLVIKGEDAEGMALLHHAADRYNDIGAAFFIAEYINYGSDLELPTDDRAIDEAIEAFYRVLFFIDLEPSYPRDYRVSEYDLQMELYAHYQVTILYMEKFALGSIGLYARHLVSSPSYEGDRDISTYPAYSPYTRDSLKKTIEAADSCLQLPKKRHFRDQHYTATRKACRLFRDAAQALLPLEEEQRLLLARESCTRDVLQCAEHEELFKEELAPLVNQTYGEVRTALEPAGFF